MPLGPVIASPSSEPYFRAMFTAFLRLLTLVALVVMPFGMSAASAGPAPHAPAAATAGHCDEQGGQPAEDPGDRLAGCTAGCSMFIAEIAPAEAPVAIGAQSLVRPIARRWSSLPPETATPPPKRA